MGTLSAAEGRTGRSWRNPDTWHLRTKLLLSTMLLLVGVCAVVGALLYAFMDRQLTRQLDAELAQASRRAAELRTPPGQVGKRPDPLEARGQGAGTLNARLSGGRVEVSGVISADGTRVPLRPSDTAVLAALPVAL